MDLVIGQDYLETLKERAPFGRVMKLAEAKYDGHVTICKFTTGWKVVFGTPYDDDALRATWMGIPEKMSLDEACTYALQALPEWLRHEFEPEEED